MVKKFLTTIIRVIDYSTQAMLAAFTIIVFVNLIGRYFFAWTILWSEQISKYLFIWTCFLGVILVTVRGQHLLVDVLVSKFPRVKQMWAIIIGNLLSMGFLILLGIGGVLILPQLHGHTDPPLMVPLSYAFSVLPIFAFLTVIVILEQSYSLLRNLASEGQKNTLLEKDKA